MEKDVLEKGFYSVELTDMYWIDEMVWLEYRVANRGCMEEVFDTHNDADLLRLYRYCKTFDVDFGLGFADAVGKKAILEIY